MIFAQASSLGNEPRFLVTFLKEAFSDSIGLLHPEAEDLLMALHGPSCGKIHRLILNVTLVSDFREHRIKIDDWIEATKLENFAVALPGLLRPVWSTMNLYVGNLNFNIDQEMLSEIFSPYGEVASAHIISDRETGRSRGFGFVEMPNKAEGLAAMEDLAEADVNGRSIVINEARPKGNRY